MKHISKEMLIIYIPYSNMDWMNYKLVKKDITFHHIDKRVNGGRREMDNGALLMPVAHQYLHLIECKDVDTYIAINKLFKFINQQRYEPTKEQREIIEYLLKSFEDEHRYEKGSRGKVLIQQRYLERQPLTKINICDNV